MKMLVVYNPQGAILYMVPTNGTYKTVEVEVTEGKTLERLDLSGEEPQAVLVEQPLSLTEKLTKELEDAKKERDELKEAQNLMKLAFAEMMNNMAEGEENEEGEG
jgi:hypothetical protein|nr:MAG TPA: hypothetical protein [Caudoviricetes sp.]